MHRNDRLGALCDRIFDKLFIDILCIWPYIDKHGRRPAENECVRRRNKSKGRKNNFIALLNTRQEGRDIQCTRAGMRQQCLGYTGILFQPPMAVLGEIAITSHMAGQHRPLNIVNFITCKIRSIKRNHYPVFFSKCQFVLTGITG